MTNPKTHDIIDSVKQNQTKRVIGVAVDESKYSVYALQWAMEHLIDKDHDHIVLINVRPVILDSMRVAPFHEYEKAVKYFN